MTNKEIKNEIRKELLALQEGLVDYASEVDKVNNRLYIELEPGTTLIVSSANPYGGVSLKDRLVLVCHVAVVIDEHPVLLKVPQEVSWCVKHLELQVSATGKLCATFLEAKEGVDLVNKFRSLDIECDERGWIDKIQERVLVDANA